jgi:hypothetical protein
VRIQQRRQRTPLPIDCSCPMLPPSALRFSIRVFKCDISLNRNRILLFFTVGSSSDATDPLLAQAPDERRRRTSCPPIPLAPTRRTTLRVTQSLRVLILVNFCSTRLEADRRDLHEVRTRSPFELPHHVAKETTVRLERCDCIESEGAELVV